MSKLDKVLSTLPKMASRVMPGFTFKFSMSYFEKENTYQLSFSKDYGHTDGPLLFLQGSGNSSEEAANNLLEKFVAWNANQLTKFQDELAKHQARLASLLLNTEAVAIDAQLLVNERMD